MRGLILAFGLLAAGCAHQPPVMVRLDAIQTSVVVYQTHSEVSAWCDKFLGDWEKKTGRIAMADDGVTPSRYANSRGCAIPPRTKYAYWMILSSMETIDNVLHELCHRFTRDNSKCDGIHFDGRDIPSNGIIIEDTR